MRAASTVAWRTAPRSTALIVNGVGMASTAAPSAEKLCRAPVTSVCPAAGTMTVSVTGGGAGCVCVIVVSGAVSRTTTAATPPPSRPTTKTARRRLKGTAFGGCPLGGGLPPHRLARAARSRTAKGRLGRMSRPATLGQLRESGWESLPVKEEVRRNGAAEAKAGEPMFTGVLGYDDTVLPQLENALLAGHDIIFLGERGQAKTRMIRTLTELLDEWMPVVAGSEINDDPYEPVSKHARDLVREHGDDTPI